MDVAELVIGWTHSDIHVSQQPAAAAAAAALFYVIGLQVVVAEGVAKSTWHCSLPGYVLHDLLYVTPSTYYILFVCLSLGPIHACSTRQVTEKSFL